MWHQRSCCPSINYHILRCVLALVLTLQACCVAIGWQSSPARSGSSPRSDSFSSMSVANMQPEQYPSAVLPLLPGADPPPGTPAWLNYILAAYKVSNQHLPNWFCIWRYKLQRQRQCIALALISGGQVTVDTQAS